MNILFYMETRGIDMNAWYPPSQAFEDRQLLLCPFDDQGFLLLRYLHVPFQINLMTFLGEADVIKELWTNGHVVNAGLRSEVKIMVTTCLSHFIRLKTKGCIPTWIRLWNTHQCHLSSYRFIYSSFIFSCSNFFKNNQKHEFLEWFWDTMFFWKPEIQSFPSWPNYKTPCQPRDARHRTNCLCLRQLATDIEELPMSHKTLIERCN